MEKEKLLFDAPTTPIILRDTTSLENHGGKIEQIENKFIIYNLVMVVSGCCNSIYEIIYVLIYDQVF